MPLGLPPLPPVSTWSTFFPRKYLTLVGASMPNSYRGFPHRTVLASPKLADKFVRSLKIRDNEVVIEAFPGVGQLTRSLLRGGQREDSESEMELRRRWWEERDPSSSANSTGNLKRDSAFPNWLQLYQPGKEDRSKEQARGQSGEEGDELSISEASGSKKPAAVVVCEPSPELAIMGLGMDESHRIDPMDSNLQRDNAYHNISNMLVGTAEDLVLPIHQSRHEPRLYLTPANPYLWHVLPYILEHPEIAGQVEKAGGADITSTQGEDYFAEAKRRWRGPEPHVTVVAQMPHSDTGETLCNQWIASVIGASDGDPGFIWRWGRMRMAFLVGKVLYDRLMAQPSEFSYCKATVFARALFDIKPLPPQHHVPNVDRGSRAIEARPATSAQNTGTFEALQETYKSDSSPRDVTYPSDFYPPSMSKDRPVESEPLPRPQALGLLLEPRIDTPITLETKMSWDFVLRCCFMTYAQPISIAMRSLGFGADKLVPKISMTDGSFKGSPVDPDKIVRDMDVDEWHRIVDVFHNWAFRPANLQYNRTHINDHANDELPWKATAKTARIILPEEVDISQ